MITNFLGLCFVCKRAVEACNDAPCSYARSRARVAKLSEDPRTDWDPTDNHSDISPHERTTSYPWGR